MLRKLYKYDFRCSSRKVVPLFIAYAMAIALFAVLRAVEVHNSIFDVFVSIVGAVCEFSTFAIILFAFLTAIARFKTNLFTDEGYLMNTLPVKPWQHITSKLLNAFSWGLMSGAVALAGFCCFSVSSGTVEDFGQIIELAKALINAFKDIEVILMILFIVGFVIMVCTFGFFITALENSVALLKKSGVAKVLTFIVAYFITIVVTALVAWGIDKSIELLDISPRWTFTYVFACLCTIELVLITVFFALACKIMGKKLNLE